MVQRGVVLVEQRHDRDEGGERREPDAVEHARIRTLASVWVSASTGPSKPQPKNDAPRFITGALDAGSVRKSTTKGTASALVTAGTRNSQAGSVRARRCAATPPRAVPAIPPIPDVIPSHAPASSVFML